MDDETAKPSNEIVNRGAMRRARTVQLAMLPKAPRLPGLDIHAHYQPLEEVSGDFYDFINVSPGHIGIVLGDVSGHGVDAALLMAVAKKTIQLAARGQSSPRETLLTATEDLVADLPGNQFVSVFYGVLDLRTLSLKFVSAGFMPPLLANRGRRPAAQYLKATGTVISGATASHLKKSLEEQEISLRQGDTLVLYSDGLTEAANAAGEQFDDTGLLRAAGTFTGESARSLAEHVLAEQARHVAGTAAEDDLSMVLVSVTGAPAAPATPSAVAQPAARTNLRLPTTSMIGRATECAEIAALLGADGALVTVTGGAGIGKTRVAQVVGQEFAQALAGGAWLASLAEASSADDVAAVIAGAIGVQLTDNRPPVEALGALLSDRAETLLILDNFENLDSNAREAVKAWRARAPRVRWLVTSHRALGLQGEREFRLQPLSAPERRMAKRGARSAAKYESVRLFVDRARDVRPNFELTDMNAAAVAEICSRMEGLPLAIELAAARVGSGTTVEHLRDRVSRDTGVIRMISESDAGDKVLREAIEGSFASLTEREKKGLVQLCMFKRGFFLEAAQAVIDVPSSGDAQTTVSVVQSLLDKSLLHAHDTPYGRRFGMFVPIREFARRKRGEMFDATQQEALSLRFIRYFAAYGVNWADRVMTRHGVESLDRLQPELDNLYVAQDLAEGMGRAVYAAQIAWSAAVLTRARGPVNQDIPRLQRAVAGLADEVSVWRCRALQILGILHSQRVSIERGVELSEEAVAYARLHFPGLPLARTLTGLANANLFARRPERALELLKEAEIVGAGACAQVELALITAMQAMAMMNLGQLDEALAINREAERSFREQGATIGLEIVSQIHAFIAFQNADFETASKYYAECQRISRKLGGRLSMARSLLNQAAVAQNLVRLEEMKLCAEQAEPIARDGGYREVVARALYFRGWVMAALGEREAARRLVEKSSVFAKDARDQVQLQLNSRWLAQWHYNAGELAKAREFVADCRAASAQMAGKGELFNAEHIEALVLLDQGQPEEARRVILQAKANLLAETGLSKRTLVEQGWRLFLITAILARVELASGDAKTAHALGAELVKSYPRDVAPYLGRSELLDLAVNVMEDVLARLRAAASQGS